MNEHEARVRRYFEAWNESDWEALEAMWHGAAAREAAKVDSAQ